MDTIVTNQLLVVGTIKTAPVFSHEVFGEKFYSITIGVERMSKQVDSIPVIVSERLIDLNTLTVNTVIVVKGQLRSFNKKEDNKNHLVLTMFARSIEFSQEPSTDVNNIELTGYICKAPVYRKTPLGREICDILLAVNRSYGKSDYIPCICWGRNARYSKELDVGTKLKVQGRIQSRTYQKEIEDNNFETYTTYEVSISKLEIIKED